MNSFDKVLAKLKQIDGEAGEKVINISKDVSPDLAKYTIEFPYYAFFDVDETLINTKSMFDFMKYFFSKECNRFSLQLGTYKYFYYRYKLKFLSKIGFSRLLINKLYYLAYKNRNIKITKNLGEMWFQEKMHTKGFFNHKIINELEEHKRNGAGIVLVSGSFDACLSPLKKYLKADYCLCVNLETSNGKYTGKVIQPQTIGEGKAKAIKSFLTEQKFTNLQGCYAYGDHLSDIPMMKLVGNPIAVVNNESLKNYAIKHGWRTISL